MACEPIGRAPQRLWDNAYSACAGHPMARGPVALVLDADPTTGRATLTVPGSATSALDNELSDWLWEVELDDGVTDPVVVAAGILHVLASVT